VANLSRRSDQKTGQALGAFISDLVVFCSWHPRARLRSSRRTEQQRPSCINADGDIDTLQGICRTTGATSDCGERSAVLRRNVEQLSIKQERRIGDSAPAQPTGQDVTKKTSSLVNDLALLQRDVEQLSSKQEQMSRDIATVQATEQSVSERISSLTKAAPVHPMSRKNIPRVVHAEAPRQSATASVPPQTSPAGAESAIDQPPRPPLPIPMSTETPSPVH
jgi:hypothetical protein